MNAESQPAMQECVTVAFDGPVATLTLQHGSMNAIDGVLLDELAATFAIVEADSEVSVRRIRVVSGGFFLPGRTFDWSPDASKAQRALTR